MPRISISLTFAGETFFDSIYAEAFPKKDHPAPLSKNFRQIIPRKLLPARACKRSYNLHS
jgi:hypothetical protein